ncbi:MAG: hypothetical protein ACK57N_01115 [Planctomycetia bacterium]
MPGLAEDRRGSLLRRVLVRLVLVRLFARGADLRSGRGRRGIVGHRFAAQATQA